MGVRVIQFSTGNVGRHALRQLIERPDLELVGVHASGPDKVGRDAAELCGLDTPTGVTATDDLDALVALGADCVVYTSQAETRPHEALAELTAFLGPGPTWWPPRWCGWSTRPTPMPGSASPWRPVPAGGTTMYVNGVDPGFSGTSSPWPPSASPPGRDRPRPGDLRLRLLRRRRVHRGQLRVRHHRPTTVPMLFLPGVLASIWGGPVRLLADELGVELDGAP
jgi:hypothetical protein